MQYSGFGLQRALLVLSSVCVMVLAGCVPVEPIEINEEFTLEFGGTGHNKRQDMLVIFDGVVEDSRCPSTVNCIVAGQVTLALSLTVAGTTEHLQLTLGDNRDNAIHRFGDAGDYELELLSVSPYPETEEPLPQKKYLATFIIRRVTFCPEIYAPVCGNEFKRTACLTMPCKLQELYKTYGNRCEANGARADVFFEGECDELEATPVEQSHDCLVRYSPFCDCNGTGHACSYTI